MNEQIKKLLRLDPNNSVDLYAAARIEELESDRDKLVKFAREIIGKVLDGCDWYGGSVQELAEECGLIEPEIYDPDKHGDDYLGLFEPGDTIYFFADVLKERVTDI